MLANWSDKLLDYNFTVIHCPGISHVLPDYLSRMYHLLEEPRVGIPQINLVEPHIPDPHHAIARHIRDVLEKSIPEDKSLILDQYHILNHQGAAQLFRKNFDAGYYWPELRKDCSTTVSHCKACLAFNVSVAGFNPLQTIDATLPMDHVAVDLFGPFTSSRNGATYALLLIDIATRFVWLSPLQDKSAASVAKALFEIFCQNGFPKIIQSDNGTEFVNSLIHVWLEQTGVTHRLITPYHPEANGAAERHVGIAKSLLFKLLQGDDSEWDLYLPAVQYGINNRISSRHRSAPFALFHARSANNLSDHRGSKSTLALESDLIERARDMIEIVYPSIQKMTQQYNEKLSRRFSEKKRIVKSFSKGDSVMRLNLQRGGKSDAIWVGPYNIVATHGAGSYSLCDATGANFPSKVAQKHLKRVLVDSSADADDHFEVDRILSHRGIGAKREYLVSWKGYPDSENSWVLVTDFDSLEVVANYHKAVPTSVGSATRKRPRKSVKRRRI